MFAHDKFQNDLFVPMNLWFSTKEDSLNFFFFMMLILFLKIYFPTGFFIISITIYSIYQNISFDNCQNFDQLTVLKSY